MNAKIKNGELVITLPLEKPRYSSTGKTMIIASTRGVNRTTARFRGKDVSITANAFIYRDLAPKKTRKEMEALLEATFAPLVGPGSKAHRGSRRILSNS